MTATVERLRAYVAVVGEHDLARQILIVEDDQFTGALLANLLVAHGFSVRVEHSAAAAKAALDDFEADGALIDIQLGDGPSGISLAHVISQLHPACGLALLTRFPDPSAAGLADEDLPAGCGFLRKDKIADAGYLLAALEEILTDHGEDYRDDLATDRPLGGLTPTQMEVLRLVAAGLTNSAIARRRGTTESAVEQTLTAIIKALALNVADDVNPRMELARQFIRVAGLPERP